MIKVVSAKEDGTPMVFLGLSELNVEKLKQDQPILVELSELGLPATQVVIFYGKTERHATAQLEQLGLLPPGTASDMPEPRPDRTASAFFRQDNG